MVRLSLLISDDAMLVERLPQQKTAGVYWGVIAVTEHGGWSGEALSQLFARLRRSGGAWDLCLIAEIENVLKLLIKHLYKKSGAQSVELHLSVYDAGSLIWLRPVLTEFCQRLMREEQFVSELLFCWHIYSVERSLLAAEAATKSTLAVQVAAKQGRPDQMQLTELNIPTKTLQAVPVRSKIPISERWLLVGMVASGLAFCAALALFFI